MQDLRSITNGGGVGGVGGGGGGGRFFGVGGGGGGDRRLRPYPNQALKCPRCDSLNTKFCYYNNYNLSQPRHFCKSCRRYWTKGGVLRNVPVGGGCRKTKRSKPKSSSSNSDHRLKEKKSSTSHSSSDSSSLTATTTTTTTNDAAASSSSVPGLFSFPDSSSLFMNQTPPNPNPNTNPNTNFQPSVLENLDHHHSGIFAENGSFTSLMSVGNTYDFSPFRLNHQHQQQEQEIELQQQQQQKMTSMVEEMKMQELTAAGVGIDLSGIENRASNGDQLTGLDWHSSQGLFDLPNSVDHGYWNQNQWTDNDQHLYLP